VGSAAAGDPLGFNHHRAGLGHQRDPTTRNETPR
jgi:hypothetical protein